MLRSEGVRVGITLITAVVLLAGAWFALSRTPLGVPKLAITVMADDAQGISRSSPVRMNGVDIGLVREVGFDEATGKPKLTLDIRGDLPRPIDHKVRIKIAAGMIGFSAPYVEITPRPGIHENEARLPKNLFVASSEASIEELVPKANELVDNLNQLTLRMNDLTEGFARIAKDPGLQRDLRRTTRNFAEVSESGTRIARNLEVTTGRAANLVSSFSGVSQRFNTTAREVDRTLQQAQVLIGDMRGVAQATKGAITDAQGVAQSGKGAAEEARLAMADVRARMGPLFDRLNTSMASLQATLEDARKLLPDPALKQDLQVAVANLKDASGSLKQVGSDVQGLTSDPQVQKDLREAIAGLREATQAAGAVFERVNRLLGGGKSGGGSGGGIGQVRNALEETQLRAEFLRSTRPGGNRLDVDATIPWGDGFWRTGFYDFTESNRFNLQYGRPLGANSFMRYGLHASKLGLGLDWGSPVSPWLGLDLYGVDEPRLDVRGNLRLNESLDLTLGLDRVFERNVPIFGVRYRR